MMEKISFFRVAAFIKNNKGRDIIRVISLMQLFLLCAYVAIVFFSRN